MEWVLLPRANGSTANERKLKRLLPQNRPIPNIASSQQSLSPNSVSSSGDHRHRVVRVIVIVAVVACRRRRKCAEHVGNYGGTI